MYTSKYILRAEKQKTKCSTRGSNPQFRWTWSSFTVDSRPASCKGVKRCRSFVGFFRETMQCVSSFYNYAPLAKDSLHEGVDMLPFFSITSYWILAVEGSFLNLHFVLVGWSAFRGDGNRSMTFVLRQTRFFFYRLIRTPSLVISFSGAYFDLPNSLKFFFFQEPSLRRTIVGTRNFDCSCNYYFEVLIRCLRRRDST